MAADRAVRPFRECGSCRAAWPRWEDFVLDASVRLLGLQFDPAFPEINLLVFEHVCGSSISILSKRLSHLLPGLPTAAPSSSLRGTDQCRRHCRRLEDLEACDAPCVNARDRGLIRLIQALKGEGHKPVEAGAE